MSWQEGGLREGAGAHPPYTLAGNSQYMVSTGQSEPVEAMGGGLRMRIGGEDVTGVIVEGGWPTAASPAADTAGAPVGHTTVVCEELPLPSLAAMVAAMAITAISSPRQTADSTPTSGVKALAGGGAAALALAPSTSMWSKFSDTGPLDAILWVMSSSTFHLHVIYTTKQGILPPHRLCGIH